MTDINNGKKTPVSKTKKSTAVKKEPVVTKNERMLRALPNAEALKARFKAGSIPLQSDFSDLIDMADIGVKAVGSEETGWGLRKDHKERLAWDPKFIFNTYYDLSASKDNKRLSLNNVYAGEMSMHKKTAILAFEPASGPHKATNEKVGDNTLFMVPAVKIESNGTREYIKVRIIAEKAIGEGSGAVPFEYVNGGTNTDLNMWYRFTLDPGADDFTDSTLVIDPLMLGVYYIPDFANDPKGEIISLLNVNFIYTSTIQIIKPSNGIAMVESGLAIKLAKGSHNNGGGGQGKDGATSGSAGGLNLSSNGLSIDAGIGIQIDEKGLGVKLTANSGLSVDESKGLKVQSGAGLQVNGDGIGLLPEQTFQKGMIMMFSGSATPAGWALCDGNNGTPDLVDRFIMGGNLSGINGVSSAKFTGDKNNKKFSTSTNNNNSQNITVKVGETALTVDQMPSHSHETGQRYSTINAVDKYGFVVDKVPFSGYYIVNNSPVIAYGTSRYVYPYTQPIGAGKSHTHSSSATLPAHQHAIDITPPYYILAFIIKL